LQFWCESRNVPDVATRTDVALPELVEGSAQTLSYSVTLEDDDFDAVVVALRYYGRPQLKLWLISFEIRPRPGTSLADTAALSPSEVKRLPITRWDKAARAAIARHDADVVADGLRAMAGAVKRLSTIADVQPDLVGGDAEELLQRARAGELEQSSRWRTAERHARVAEVYRAAVAAGAPDPSKAVARAFGNAKPSTARSWVRRAREAGYLEPEVDPTPDQPAAALRGKRKGKR